MIAVFDTNIIIDALNGVAAADAEYSRYERVLISRITWMEVLVTRNTRDFHIDWSGIRVPYELQAPKP